MKEEKTYQVVNVVTLIATLSLLLLSFLQVSPSWKYIGDNVYSGNPTYSLSFYYYFLQIRECFSTRDILSIFCGITIILFYIALFTCIVSVVFKWDWLTFISLLFVILCNILSITSLINPVVVFSAFSLIACLLLVVINILFNKTFVAVINSVSNSFKKQKMIQIGNNIKRERSNKNLTQEELANKVYVSRTLITKFESGERMPSEDQIESIAEALKIDPAILTSKNKK